MPNMAAPASGSDSNNDHLVQSDNPEHPANLIPVLCAKFWTLGWVTGTGGGASIREEYCFLPSAKFFCCRRWLSEYNEWDKLEALAG